MVEIQTKTLHADKGCLVNALSTQDIKMCNVVGIEETDGGYIITYEKLVVTKDIPINLEPIMPDIDYAINAAQEALRYVRNTSNNNADAWVTRLNDTYTTWQAYNNISTSADARPYRVYNTDTSHWRISRDF